MKLVIKGAYRGEEQLPTAHLPENAVPYLEPDDPAALNRAACRFLLPCFLLAVVIVLLKLFSPSGFTFHIGGIFLGILLFFPLRRCRALLFSERYAGICRIGHSYQQTQIYLDVTFPQSSARACPIADLPFSSSPFVCWQPALWAGALWTFCRGGRLS